MNTDIYKLLSTKSISYQCLVNQLMALHENQLDHVHFGSMEFSALYAWARSLDPVHKIPYIPHAKIVLSVHSHTSESQEAIIHQTIVMGYFVHNGSKALNTTMNQLQNEIYVCTS